MNEWIGEFQMSYQRCWTGGLPALNIFVHAEYHAMMPSGEKTNVKNAMHHPLTRYRCLITNAGEKGLLLSWISVRRKRWRNKYPTIKRIDKEFWGWDDFTRYLIYYNRLQYLYITHHAPTAWSFFDNVILTEYFVLRTCNLEVPVLYRYMTAVSPRDKIESSYWWSGSCLRPSHASQSWISTRLSWKSPSCWGLIRYIPPQTLQ